MTKSIKKSVYNANQSWYLDEILDMDGKKLHLEVRRNAYEFQSHAKIELWDGIKWNQIQWVPGCNVHMKRSYVEKGVTAADFAQDRKELLAIAKAVLS